MTTDTIQIDHQLLEQLQQDPRYAYAIEEEKPSLLSELFSKLGRWLGEYLEGNATFLRPLIYLLCVLTVCILIWWMVRSGLLKRLLGNQQATEVSIEEAEEDIHHVDFDAAIDHALSAGDYTLAARLLYLQTLKNLSDQGRISWQPQKTPTQYTHEVTTLPFRQLTNHFLHIRYGGFEADASLFVTMKALKEDVEKGGAA